MESSQRIFTRIFIILFIYCVNLSESSQEKITKIYGLVFDPSYAKPGERLCMTLNYTIEEEHYLQKLQLDVGAEEVTEIYSFTKKHATDSGEPHYFDNDWGNRAGKARFDLDRTFCFRSIKEGDLGLTFVWRLYSTSRSTHGNKARFHYFFNFPTENSIYKEGGPSPYGLTKMNRIIFEPTYAKIGDPLCMNLNYTIEDGHYLHLLQLEVDTKGNEEEGTKVYSFVRRDPYDQGSSEYQNNEWGRRAIRIRHDEDKMFCFQFITEDDLKRTFIWRLFSVNRNHREIKSRFHYFFKISESSSERRLDGEGQSAGKIYGLTFNPEYVQDGQALCMRLNYSIERGHFLKKLHLEVEADSDVEIYSFARKNEYDPGAPVYGSNDWGRRIDIRRGDKEKLLCFTVIKSSDFNYRYVWRLMTQNINYDGIKSNFHYFFRIPEHVVSKIHSSNVGAVDSSSERRLDGEEHVVSKVHSSNVGAVDSSSERRLEGEGQSASKIYGLTFNPEYVQDGQALCMRLNYSIERGHFLKKLHLEVEADSDVEIYSFAKKNEYDPGAPVYGSNDWGRRIDIRRGDKEKLLCFTTIKSSDFNYRYVWRLMTQNINYDGIKSNFHYFFRIPEHVVSKVHSSNVGAVGSSQGLSTIMNKVNFNPSYVRIGRPLCMFLDYSIESSHYLSKVELESVTDGETKIYSFTRQSKDDPGSAHFYHNDLGNRVDKTQTEKDKVLCFTEVKQSDMGHVFNWKLHSQSSIPSDWRIYTYTFRMPDQDLVSKPVINSQVSSTSSFTKIYEVTFNPNRAVIGGRLCLTVNYTLKTDHFLKRLQLDAESEGTTEIYSFTKEDANDPGKTSYENNVWGNRAERSRTNNDKMFCFRTLRRSDLNQMFAWTVESQNEDYSTITRKYRYVFSLPDENGKFVDKLEEKDKVSEKTVSTKINGIEFNPSYVVYNNPLCMNINYTVESGHYLHEIRFEVAGTGTEIYSLTKKSADDPGSPYYYSNDWGKRILQSSTDMDKILCFTSMKRSDMDHAYIWRIISRNLKNQSSRSRFSYNFRFPSQDSESTGIDSGIALHHGKYIYGSSTKIHKVNFDPDQSILGMPLCMLLNYTIQRGHFMDKLRLTVDGEKDVYTFTRKNDKDEGQAEFFDNDWGKRADKEMANKEKMFCFTSIKENDIDLTYVWTIQSQSIEHAGVRRRFHYIFNIPNLAHVGGHTDKVSFHSALTKIYGIQFDPPNPKPGQPLCMALNYTTQEGHFLQKLKLEVDSDDNPEIFSLVKQNADDPGIVMYMENDWGDRAERTGKNKDKTFCLKSVKPSDLKHTYVWTLQSQNSLYPGITRRFRYLFTIPDKEDDQRSTKFNGVKFEPEVTELGDPLCMQLNYTIQKDHFLYLMELEVDADDGRRKIFTFSRPRVLDPGVAIYQDNDWGNRAERRSYDKDKLFCFKFMKEDDIDYDYLWTIHSQGLINHSDKQKSQLSFNLPDFDYIDNTKDIGATKPPATRITGITYDPPYATEGDPFCIAMNYTIENGHFLHNVRLEVGDEDEIYSFIRPSEGDLGIVVYQDNDWGKRAERVLSNRDRAFCFETIRRSDLGQKFIWTIQSLSIANPQIKRKYHYAFALPDYNFYKSADDILPASERSQVTKINGVFLTPQTVMVGRPLCLTLDYTLQTGHFLNSMNLEADVNDGSDIYTYTKLEPYESEIVSYPVNNWGNRIKKMSKDRDKTICFEKIEVDDLKHNFIWTIVSQSFISPLIRKKDQTSFALVGSPTVDPIGTGIDGSGSVTKIHGISFSPSYGRPDEPLCMMVDYTVQDGYFLKSLILEAMGDDKETKIYSFTKTDPKDSGQVDYYPNNWGERIDKKITDEDQIFCFTEIKKDDFDHTFMWRLESQNMYNKDLQRSAHYSFSLPDHISASSVGSLGISPYVSSTKINGVNFKPTYSEFNKPLSMALNYTLEKDHFLKQASLAVLDGSEIPMYSFNKKGLIDPPESRYYANNWSIRGEKKYHQKQPRFTFRNVKNYDLGYVFLWKIISQSVFNPEDTKASEFSFRIPEEEKIGKLESEDYNLLGRFDAFHDTTNGKILQIHGSKSSPEEASVGGPMCLTANYTIAEGYFLRQLVLQTNNDEPEGIYSYTKRHPDDEGVPFYFDNSWGNRGDRENNDKNKSFCLLRAEDGDFALPLIWKVYAQDSLDPLATAKDSYVFSVPDGAPHDHYGGFDDRNHVTVELIVGLMVAFVVLFAFLGLLMYLFCCQCGMDSNCTCTPDKSCGRDTEACLAQQRLLSQQ